MRSNFKLSLALLSAAISMAAFAAPQEDPMAKAQGQSMSQSAATSTDTKTLAQTKFDALDVNHDGYIDKQEAAVSKPLQSEFAKLDANNDGKLSLVEFQNVKDLASIKTSRDGYQQ